MTYFQRVCASCGAEQPDELPETCANCSSGPLQIEMRKVEPTQPAAPAANIGQEATHMPPQGDVDATERAREIARGSGIDLTQIVGTGAGGKITVKDVEKAARG